MNKKLFCMALVLLLLAAFGASAATKIQLDAEEGKVTYAFQLAQTDEFAILEYKGPADNGKMVLYGEDGSFSGEILLPYSGKGGKVTVTLKNMKDVALGKGTVTLPKEKGYTVPKGKSNVKVENLVLTETVEGFGYSFEAPGTDFMLLQFRNKQESGEMYVFPDENGVYTGQVALPLTYARTLTTVKICTVKEAVKKEDTVRKAYQMGPAPTPREGRLSGVVVCIDPGHQENGKMVREPIGPGLEGYTSGTSGMAQGKVTMRKESIVVLEIAEKLRNELISQGATVVMTRETQDVFHTNLERCQIAEDGGAFIMLRLHADTRADVNKRGISIYTPLNSDYAKAVASKEDYKHMGQLMLDATKTAVGYKLDTTTGYVHMGDGFVGNNWAKMTCFLIELGFMSNVQDEHLLSQPQYQQWLAEGMAQGVYEIAVFRGLVEAEE
mgnify:CR=1 FL=1